jgi:hypothetical protein
MGKKKYQEGYDSCSGTVYDYRDDQDSDDSEDLQPAKRRRLSPSYNDLTLKRRTYERYVQQPYNNKSYAELVQTQVEQSSTTSPRDRLQSKMASTTTSIGD